MTEDQSTVLLFHRAGLLSESEFEDDPSSQIVLPQKLATRGAAAESKSAIRVFELGPRISMQLIKVKLLFMGKAYFAITICK